MIDPEIKGTVKLSFTPIEKNSITGADIPPKMRMGKEEYNLK